ncbi:hypothetical protein OIE66_14175 [Nonomuraea sp. NBC_01738]|nr:hypothetical protein OIE66_14175 [Nonomuraea sp. NBC_01738]
MTAYLGALGLCLAAALMPLTGRALAWAAGLLTAGAGCSPRAPASWR